MILAVDCGLRVCGAALLYSATARLHAAAVVERPGQSAPGVAAWDAMARAVRVWVATFLPLHGGLRAVVLETQRVYPAARQRGDPNDLLELMGVAGAMNFPPAPRYSYAPREWKGQMPGDDFIRERIRPLLSDEEEAAISGASSVRHNAYDAVGLGMFHLGRLRPHRVLPGAT